VADQFGVESLPALDIINAHKVSLTVDFFSPFTKGNRHALSVFPGPNIVSVTDRFDLLSFNGLFARYASRIGVAA
jgi:hypothetical protein